MSMNCVSHNYIVGENGLSSAGRNYMKKMAMDKIVEQSEPLIVQDKNDEYTNLAKELGTNCLFIK